MISLNIWLNSASLDWSISRLALRSYLAFGYFLFGLVYKG